MSIMSEISIYGLLHYDPQNKKNVSSSYCFIILLVISCLDFYTLYKKYTVSFLIAASKLDN